MTTDIAAIRAVLEGLYGDTLRDAPDWVFSPAATLSDVADAVDVGELIRGRRFPIHRSLVVTRERRERGETDDWALRFVTTAADRTVQWEIVLVDPPASLIDDSYWKSLEDMFTPNDEGQRGMTRRQSLSTDELERLGKLVFEVATNDVVFERLMRSAESYRPRLAAGLSGRPLTVRLRPDGGEPGRSLLIDTDGSVREVEVELPVDLTIQGPPTSIGRFLAGDLHPLMAFYQRVLRLSASIPTMVRYAPLVALLSEVIMTTDIEDPWT